MGKVTDTLIELLRRQVEARHTVVWYDDQAVYAAVAAGLRPEQVAGAAVHCYDPGRGFLALRHDLEPSWSGDQPPRLIIYVPLRQAATGHALIEYEVGGVVVQPGASPQDQNTSLPVIARAALRAVVPPAQAEQMASQAEAGQLSLADLDNLAEQAADIHTGVLKTLFGSGDARVVALAFLSNGARDAEIGARHAVDNLAQLLSAALGVAFDTRGGVAGLRAQLARHILVTDLVVGLGDATPPSLRSVRLADSEVARREAVEWAAAWRNQRDAGDAYTRHADQVQADYNVRGLSLDLDALRRIETFAATEAMLQATVEAALVAEATPDLAALVEARGRGFWSSQQPETRARWGLIGDAAHVLIEARRVERALKAKVWSVAALIDAYTQGETPWCALDTWQRRLERDHPMADHDPHSQPSLTQLVAHARGRYAQAADLLATRFSHAYHDARFEAPKTLAQGNIYAQRVAPEAQRGRVAYVLVDALRFEMARELQGLLGDLGQATLEPALATAPTITEVGMAALLPGAERGVTLSQYRGALTVQVAGKTLKNRADRVAHFEASVGPRAAVARLEDIAPLQDKALRQRLASADVILVTSTEIDATAENTPAFARRTLDEALTHLRRGLRTLVNLGVPTIVVTADHGYLFGERLDAGQTIDPPSSKAVVLKRRVWLGQGGADLGAAALRTPLAALGVTSALELATPWNLAVFKVAGGALEYFHGGLSPQELITPLLTLRAGAPATPAAHAPGIQWSLTPGSQTITTRVVSVTITGQPTKLLPVEPPLVRVEVRAQGALLSTPISAAYGFQEQTRDVQLRAVPDDPMQVERNTVTLQIVDAPGVSHVTIHLLDAATGATLYKTDPVPMSISL